MAAWDKSDTNSRRNHAYFSANCCASVTAVSGAGSAAGVLCFQRRRRSRSRYHSLLPLCVSTVWPPKIWLTAHKYCRRVKSGLKFPDGGFDPRVINAFLFGRVMLNPLVTRAAPVMLSIMVLFRCPKKVNFNTPSYGSMKA